MSLPLALEISESRGRASLQHGDSLSDLLANVSSADAWLVLDGIDRATHGEQFLALANIINAAISKDDTPWRILLTCQQEHVPRVRRLLSESGVDVSNWTVDRVEPLSKKEVEAVTYAVPAIKPVVRQPQLFELTRRPLILDLLVRSAEDGEVPRDGWVGESHLVEWFWETRVRGRVGVEGSEALIELGRRQADLEEIDTAIADLAVSGDMVEQLLTGGLLRERDGRVAFDHDTLGDWARLRWLLARGASLANIIEARCENPLWHHAFRLVAIHRLEHSSGTNEWEELIESCESVLDFALDGLLFAANSQTLFERVADRLFADDAVLARRLIRRAVVICTTPNEWLLKRAASQLESPTPFLRTLSRDPKPFHFFWGPLLQFLRQERERVATTMAKDAAEAAKVWLEMTPSNWPYRDAAADVALTIAEKTLDDRLSYRGSSTDDDAKLIYEAALYAFEDEQVRAKTLFLQACSLVLPPEIKSRQVGRFRLPGDEIAPSPFDDGAVRTVPEPWSGGPIVNADDSFRDACFSNYAMCPLFENDPALARQLLLALLIDVRRPECPGGGYFARFDNSSCGLIHRASGLSAPHYQQGPFLTFLHCAPDEAIQFVLDVVNFASARAAEGVGHRRPDTIYSIDSLLDDGNLWNGDELVLTWNRAHLTACHMAVAPLVALEKWLGDRVDAGESIDTEIESILAGTCSVAIAGMLADVGRRHPKLFDGPLRSLLKSPVFLLWSETLIHDPTPPRLGGPDIELGERFFEEHKGWLFAEYRQRSLMSDSERILCPAELRWDEVESGIDNTGSEVPLDQRFDTLRQLAANRTPAWVAHANEQMGIAIGQMTNSSNAANQEQTLAEGEIAESRFIFEALENEGHLRPEDLATLSEKLPELTDIPDKEDAELHFLTRYARLGLATFLLVRHEKWLKENKLWNEYLDHVVRETLDLELFSFCVSSKQVGWFDWRYHLAAFSIQLWSKSPDDKNLLTWVAHLSIFSSGIAKRRLLSETFAARSDLGDHVLRLVHLVLRSAAAWWEIGQNSRSAGEEFDINGWWDRELGLFLSGRLSATVPPLESLYLSEPPLQYANWRHNNRYGQEIESYFRLPPVESHNVIAAVIAATPSVSATDVRSEQEERIGLIRIGLDAELAILPAYDETGRSLDIPCNEYPTMIGQSEILDRVVQEMTECQDATSVEQLWQPIIALGTKAPHWMEYLINKWLWKGLAETTVPSNLKPIWRAMIQFADGHSNWKIDRGDRDASAQSLWAILIGVDRFCYNLWRRDHATIIDSAASDIETPLSEIIRHPTTAGPALRWISRGPGHRFGVAAIEWMMSAVDNFCLQDSRDDQLLNALAEFLDALWRHDCQTLDAEPDKRRAFRSILRRVATTGNVLAIDLEQRVSGRG